MILALGDRGAEVDAMAHALLEAHWRDDADLSDTAMLSALATRLGHDGDALLAAAQSADVAAQYARNAQDALEAGIMGSPTYVLGGEMFYGQDRLEMLERALTRPFAPTRWVNPPVQAT